MKKIETFIGKSCSPNQTFPLKDEKDEGNFQPKKLPSKTEKVPFSIALTLVVFQVIKKSFEDVHLHKKI